MKKLLIIDDEIMALQMMERILIKENFEVIPARSANEGLELLQKIQVDGIILDVGLPDKDGFEVLKDIRNKSELRHLPVIMVTARDDEIDTIIGLEIGADDYITKPFKRRELVARIKAVFRRIERDQDYAGNVIQFGNVKVYGKHHQVYIDNEMIEMGQKEFKLLFTLINSPKKVFTREELLNIVWHEDMAIEERTVDVHIRRIRRKIEKDPNKPMWIETIRGIGYRFSK